MFRGEASARLARRPAVVASGDQVHVWGTGVVRANTTHRCEATAARPPGAPGLGSAAEALAGLSPPELHVGLPHAPQRLGLRTRPGLGRPPPVARPTSLRPPPTAAAKTLIQSAATSSGTRGWDRGCSGPRFTHPVTKTFKKSCRALSVGSVLPIFISDFTNR